LTGNGRYTGEIWTVEEDDGIAALSDADNWAEPWMLPSSRPAAFSLAATPAGEVALKADAYPEPDEEHVRTMSD